MNGAEALVRTAVAAGVEVCLANPGTTEIAFLAAIDATPGMRAVLGLFEGVCAGAADGYARMTGKPALLLFHHGPGLGNAIANLHNARKARSPVVVLVGENPRGHAALDPPLQSDIALLAANVSGWQRTVRCAGELPTDTADAIAAASGLPGQVATLIVPDDCQWSAVEATAGPPRPEGIVPQPLPSVPPQAVTAAAASLRGTISAALLLGGPALNETGLRAAGRVAAATGCRLLCEGYPARAERGGDLPFLERVPYFPEQAIRFLGGLRQVVLAGTRAPVPFFAYAPTGNRLLPAEAAVHVLATAEQDAASALVALAEEIGRRTRSHDESPPAAGTTPAPPTGPLTPETLPAAVAAAQPEGTILVEEGITSGRAYWPASRAAPRHTFMAITGGSIGWGLPCATGAALACPERPVILIEGDGSAPYTLQALWTQAREGLNVTTVICANRSYRILLLELERAGIADPGPAASSMTDLSRPDIDWVSLARGMGVPGTRLVTAEALSREVAGAAAEPGPYLIEAVMA